MRRSNKFYEIWYPSDLKSHFDQTSRPVLVGMLKYKFEHNHIFHAKTSVYLTNCKKVTFYDGQTSTTTRCTIQKRGSPHIFRMWRTDGRTLRCAPHYLQGAPHTAHEWKFLHKIICIGYWIIFYIFDLLMITLLVPLLLTWFNFNPSMDK